MTYSPIWCIVISHRLLYNTLVKLFLTHTNTVDGCSFGMQNWFSTKHTVAVKICCIFLSSPFNTPIYWETVNCVNFTILSLHHKHLYGLMLSVCHRCTPAFTNLPYLLFFLLTAFIHSCFVTGTSFSCLLRSFAAKKFSLHSLVTSFA